MFKNEADFSELIHDKPGIILSGIPEINPDLCPDGDTLGKLLSLGRDIKLDSGRIDNLYIDANAVLTFVECKCYSDSRIKRDVYSQAMNYAADIGGMLAHDNGQEFLDRFAGIISTSRDTDFSSIESVLEALSENLVLKRHNNIKEWEKQFPERLERNIKNGTCRIIIACAPDDRAPDPGNKFAYKQIRNLMKLMQFSQSTRADYDLILMDVRESGNRYDSRIIWRNYASLPFINLIPNSSRRDTSPEIEEEKNKFDGLPRESKSQLYTFIEELGKKEIVKKDPTTKEIVKKDLNTYGITLYWKKSRKSLYIDILVDSGDWCIRRREVYNPEKLFLALKNDNLPNQLTGFKFEKTPPLSGKHGVYYNLFVYPNRTEGKSLEELADLVFGILAFRYREWPH